MIISWETGAVQYRIEIYVVLNFSIPESNIVREICPPKYEGRTLPGDPGCPNVNRKSLFHMLSCFRFVRQSPPRVSSTRKRTIPLEVSRMPRIIAGGE
jgi:hypothetical protein